MKAHISYWQYNDGWTQDIQGEYSRGIPHWFCWAYPEASDEFEAWFEDKLEPLGSRAELRFNGGNMMYTVVHFNKQAASIFANEFNLNLNPQCNYL